MRQLRGAAVHERHARTDVRRWAHDDFGCGGTTDARALGVVLDSITHGTRRRDGHVRVPARDGLPSGAHGDGVRPEAVGHFRDGGSRIIRALLLPPRFTLGTLGGVACGLWGGVACAAEIEPCHVACTRSDANRGRTPTTAGAGTSGADGGGAATGDET